MSTELAHVRHPIGAIRSYLYGHLDLREMLKRAFGAVELERSPPAKGFRIEPRMGDSIVVLEVAPTLRLKVRRKRRSTSTCPTLMAPAGARSWRARPQ